MKQGRFVIAAICGIMLGLPSVQAAPTFEDGVVAYKRGDYATALTVFRPLAEKGVARAQTIIGLMYSYGEGVPVDDAEAARWYRLAAEQNNSVGQYNLGMLYLQGKGVEKSEEQAIEWLTAAARGGHFRATSELAKLDPATYSSLPSLPADKLDAPPESNQDAASASTGGSSGGDATNAMVASADREPAGTRPDSTPDTASATPRSVVLTRKASAPSTEPVTASHVNGNAGASVPSKSANVTRRESPATGSGAASGTAKPRDGDSSKTYRVQLAASQSEELIRRDWSSFQSKYPEIFGDLDGSIERAEVGESNTVWYRLRVGPFQTEARAKELCLQIQERRIRSGCLPLRVQR